MADGDLDSAQALFESLYTELHDRAGRAMRNQSPEHTLQATQLIGHAYEKLARLTGKQWANREHFLGVAASAMRCVLIDHARAKRPRPKPTPLDSIQVAAEERVVDLLAFDDARRELATVSPQMATALDMYLFNYSKVEIARALGISSKSLQRKWPAVRAFLSRHMR